MDGDGIIQDVLLGPRRSLWGRLGGASQGAHQKEHGEDRRATWLAHNVDDLGWVTITVLRQHPGGCDGRAALQPMHFRRSPGCRQASRRESPWGRARGQPQTAESGDRTTRAATDPKRRAKRRARCRAYSKHMARPEISHLHGLLQYVFAVSFARSLTPTVNLAFAIILGRIAGLFRMGSAEVTRCGTRRTESFGGTTG